MDVVDVMDGIVIWHGGNTEVRSLPDADAKIKVATLAYCKRARIEF